jgi:hypothetical protein
LQPSRHACCPAPALIHADRASPHIVHAGNAHEAAPGCVGLGAAEVGWMGSIAPSAPRVCVCVCVCVCARACVCAAGRWDGSVRVPILPPRPPPSPPLPHPFGRPQDHHGRLDPLPPRRPHRHHGVEARDAPAAVRRCVARLPPGAAGRIHGKEQGRALLSRPQAARADGPRRMASP